MRIRDLLLIVLPCLAACAAFDTTAEKSAKAPPGARTTLEGKSGVEMQGRATFHPAEGGVLVVVEVEGAPPGWHAVHVHETGDCSAEDGTSAGGHFNPTGVAHGGPQAEEHHAGDLGNMYVDAKGNGMLEVLADGLSLEGESSAIGRALIVHAGADDLVSQPTGNAGGRIACGVIR